MTSLRVPVLIDPSTAFEALCSLEDRHDLLEAIAEIALRGAASARARAAGGDL